MKDNNINQYLFIDNQYEDDLLFIVEGDLKLETLKEDFKKEYYKLIDEYRDNKNDTWEYGDFYDELNARLEKYWITIYEPLTIDHMSIMKERND